MQMYRLSVQDRQQERIRRHADIRDRDRVLIAGAIRERFGLPAGSCILDLGCGRGGMVDSLVSEGYDATDVTSNPYGKKAGRPVSPALP